MKKDIIDPNAPPRPLTDMSKPWLVVKFRRGSTVHTFYSAVNEMTGHRLSAFDNDPPSVCRFEGGHRDDAKIYRNIVDKADEIIAVSGSVHFFK